jgi:hypothetical protein
MAERKCHEHLRHVVHRLHAHRDRPTLQLVGEREYQCRVDAVIFAF